MSEDNKETSSSASVVKKQRGGVGRWMRKLLVILVLVGLGIAVYFGGRALLVRDARMTQQSEQMQTQVNDMHQQVQSMQDTVAQVASLTAEVKEQQATITDIQQAQKAGQEGVQILTAQFLVRSANESIQVENNVGRALQLTALADQELANLNNPKLYPIRQALSEDVAALKNVPALDVSGIYLQLATLSQQIEKLPLINQFENKSTKNPSEQVDASLPWWKRGLQSTALALQQIVIIRKNRLNVPPFIAPEQRDYFYQNLQMEIAHAQWALLHHDEKIYQASLQQVIRWIKQFAVASQPITQQLLTDATTLSAIHVQPDLPNLSHTLEAFQHYLANQG